MPPQFKNMNELVDYLGIVEKRLAVLESENRQLRAMVPSKPALDENLISRYVKHSLPQTNLISSSFLKRAFTVWGHFFVANLIIGFVAATLYFCFFTVLFSSILGNIIQSVPK